MRCFVKALPLALLPMLAACPGQAPPPRSISTLAPPSTPAQTPTSATDPLCASVRIVQLSRQDTTGTKAQVEANNAVLSATCG